MEAEVAKQVPAVEDDAVGSTASLEFVTGYAVKLTLQDGAIVAKAYSDINDSMFAATIQDKDLVESGKVIFGGCEGVYEAIKQCLREKHPITLSDAG